LLALLAFYVIWARPHPVEQKVMVLTGRVSMLAGVVGNRPRLYVAPLTGIRGPFVLTP